MLSLNIVVQSDPDALFEAMICGDRDGMKVLLGTAIIALQSALNDLHPESAVRPSAIVAITKYRELLDAAKAGDPVLVKSKEV